MATESNNLFSIIRQECVLPRQDNLFHYLPTGFFRVIKSNLKNITCVNSTANLKFGFLFPIKYIVCQIKSIIYKIKNVCLYNFLFG